MIFGINYIHVCAIYVRPPPPLPEKKIGMISQNICKIACIDYNFLLSEKT